MSVREYLEATIPDYQDPVVNYASLIRRVSKYDMRYAVSANNEKISLWIHDIKFAGTN